jgi:hypothetical protein
VCLSKDVAIKQHKYLDTEVIIPYGDSGEIFDKIIEWCDENEVKLIKHTRPNVINATHGKIFTASTHDIVGKNLSFILTEDESNLILRIVVEPPWYNRGLEINETLRSYHELIEPLLQILGIKKLEESTHLFNIETFETERVASYRNMYIGAVAFFFGLTWSLLGNRLIVEIPFVGALQYMGISYALYGLYRLTQAQNRIRKIDTNYVYPNITANRRLKILTILIVFFSISAIVWAFTASTYVTYENYGISFTYNRWWKVEVSGLDDDNAASYSQGMIQVSDTMNYNTVIIIGWIRLSGEQISNLNAGILAASSNSEAFVYDLGDIESSSINGCEALVRDGTIRLINSGEEKLARFCIIEDNSTRTIFLISVMTSHENGLEDYKKIINSLKANDG